MKILEVGVISYTPMMGYKISYLMEVKPGIIRRRTAVYKDGVLSKDNDKTELVKMIAREVKYFNTKEALKY